MSLWARIAWLSAAFSCFAFVVPCMSQSKKDKEQSASTDCYSKSDFTDFLNCRIGQLVALDAGQKDPAKQVQAPSSSSTASSLVDKSSVSDISGMALDAAGLSSASSQPNTTSTTGSLSAYAVRNWIEGKNSLDGLESPAQDP